MAVPQQLFGRTGHSSSRVLFGAAALGGMSQERSDEVLAVLDEYGVNHIDTAFSYGDSELRIAPWMRTRRADFFLATKTAERTGDGARRGLEESLQRLGVDSVDLVQLHNLVEEDEWQVAHAPGGAVEAMVRARDEGLVRFVGVTGHGLPIARMHLRSLERFDFDTVLFPYNFSLLQDAEYRRDVEELLALCGERDVAVQTIKAVARRLWQDGDQSAKHSWYEPLRDPAAIARAVRFTLGREQLFLNSSSDTTLLRTILDAASTQVAEAPSDDELRSDVDTLGIRPLFDRAGV